MSITFTLDEGGICYLYLGSRGQLQEWEGVSYLYPVRQGVSYLYTDGKEHLSPRSPTKKNSVMVRLSIIQPGTEKGAVNASGSPVSLLPVMKIGIVCSVVMSNVCLR